MKSPLRYQACSFDCGPTSVVNALMFLLERDEIPPTVLARVTSVACDRYFGAGDGLPGGTSTSAMAYLASWLNDYANRMAMPLTCEFIRGDEVTMRAGGKIDRALRSGGVSVTGVCLGSDHYVLLDGIEDTPACGGAADADVPAPDDGGRFDRVRMFDPYYDTWPLSGLKSEVVGAAPVHDRPFSHNRLVERWVFDEPSGTPHSFAQKCGREALLMWRA